MNTTRSQAEKTTLDLGYIRLTDAAPFIVAYELGIFEEHGLTVNLHQEISWANIRDKLVSGRLDAAQMLAPLPAMSTLGASGLRAPVLTGLVLSSNGNAITLNSNLNHAATALIAHGTVNNMPQALAHIAAERGSRPTIATVHAFSTHTILVRRWLSQHGVHPDDVRTLVVPPSQMVDSLQAGLVDGYCVGEPWNTIAAVRGVGTTVALGQQIWPDAPEKVLGVSADWHEQHPHTHLRLRQSLLQACGWLAEPDHLPQVARMLAHPHYLDVPQECLFPTHFGLRSNGGMNDVVTHRFYGREVNRPDHERALALIRGCGDLLGTPLSTDAALALAQLSWRPDLYEQTLSANAALLGDAAPT